MTFTESELQFNFDHSWAVHKYDTHRFYQGLSGAGLSGVDFIGIREGQLYLFEVKNYQRRKQWQQENPFHTIRDNPAGLSAAFAKKVEDSLLAIDAIGQYYHRSWLFRLFKQYLLRQPPARMEPAFWAQAYQLLDFPERIHAVLWLETEQAQPALRKELQEQIQNLLTADFLLLGAGENRLPGVQVQLVHMKNADGR